MLITTTLGTEPTWKPRPDTRSVAHAYRQTAKRPSRLRRWTRYTAIIVLGALGIFLGGSTVASAAGAGGFAVWDYKDDATAYIVNFCGPNEVPDMHSSAGVENVLGLNNDVPAGSEARKTYINEFFDEGQGGDGQNSADKMKQFGFIDQGKEPQASRALTGVQGWANNPSFMRYGLNLDYMTYGNSCGDIAGYGWNMVSNLMLTAVQWVNLAAMVVIHYALDNVLYDFWGAILTPFVSLFGKIFLPFMLLAAVVGPVYIWAKSRGNMNRGTAAMIWVFCVLALTAAITQRPAALMGVANNAVTASASFAAHQMFNSTNYTNQACNGGGDRRFDDEVRSDGNADISPSNPWQTAQAVFGSGNSEHKMYAADQCILENLWYGVSYQTWVNGQLSTNGEAQTRYGPALLNSVYIGTDNEEVTNGDEGQESTQLGHNEAWNGAAYFPHGDGTKNDLWGAKDQWNKSNFLAIIAAMCGNGRLAGDADKGNDNAEENAWSHCMAGQKDTTDEADRVAFQAMTGADWRGRMIIAATGMFNSFVVLLTSGLIAIYLIYKKVGFYFLVLFLPIFMAIGVWPGAKGKRFFWKFWEMAFANIMQQAVAVIMLLFVSYLFALVMAPSSISGVQIPFNDGAGAVANSTTLPYMLKPLMCVAVLAGMVTFIMPFRKMAKAAVAGNVDEFAKYAKPGTYGKPAAKAAVVVGAGVAVAATGGGAALLGAAKVAGTKAAAQAAAGGAGKATAAKAGLSAGKKLLSESGAGREGAVRLLDTARRLDRARGGMGKASAAVHGFMGMSDTSRKMREEVAEGKRNDILAANTEGERREAWDKGVEGIVSADPARFGLAAEAGKSKNTFTKDGRDGTTPIPATAWNEASQYLETELADGHPKLETQRAATEKQQREERIDTAYRAMSDRYMQTNGAYLPGSPQALDAQNIVSESQIVEVQKQASASAFADAGRYASSSNYQASGGVLGVTPVGSVYQNLGLAGVMGDSISPDTGTQREALVDNINSYVGQIADQPATIDMSHPAAGPIMDYIGTSPSDPAAMRVAQAAQSAVASYGYPGRVEAHGTEMPPESWKNTAVSALMPDIRVNGWDDRVELAQQVKSLAYIAPLNAENPDAGIAGRFNHLASSIADTRYGNAEINREREEVLQAVFDHHGRFTDHDYSNPDTRPVYSEPGSDAFNSPTNSPSDPPPTSPAPTPVHPLPPVPPRHTSSDDHEGRPNTSSMVTGAAAAAAAGAAATGQKDDQSKYPRPKKRGRHSNASDEQTDSTTEAEEQTVVQRADSERVTETDSLFEGTRRRGLSWMQNLENEENEEDNGDTGEDTDTDH